MFKIKVNKRLKLIIVGCLIMLLILILLRTKSYEINYSIDSSEVKETYDSDKKLYKFLFKVNDNEYIIQVKHKYIHKKKLIKKIELNEVDNITCIIPYSKKLNLYPLCRQNEGLINYTEISNKDLISDKYFKKIKEENKEYKGIKINYLNNKKYFIWNYKGFNVIDGKNNKSIEIYKDDIYNIPIAWQNDKYILLGDYSKKYKFNKFYIIKARNNKVKELKSDYEFSFDSYILGDYKNNIYLMDKKNKKEYEINSKKISNITRKNKGKIIKDNEWENISINKLSNNEYKFSKSKNYDYQLKENKLYLVIDNYNILVSNNNVKEIVKIDNDTIYYIVDDKLYLFEPTMGEVLVMSNFEWNFNYKNMIYIF